MGNNLGYPLYGQDSRAKRYSNQQKKQKAENVVKGSQFGETVSKNNSNRGSWEK